MNHYVYKIENILTGMYYIGKRSTCLEPSEDRYMGSGRYIRAAIKKYGIENFRKSIILELDSATEALAYERKLVDESVVNDEMSYNLCLGGWSHDRTGDSWSEESKQKMRDSAKVRKSLSEEDRQKISMRMVGKKRPDLVGKTGPRSEAARKNQSDRHRGKPLSDHHKKAIQESRRKMLPEERIEKFGTRKGGVQSNEERKKRSDTIREWWKKRKNEKEEYSIDSISK